MIKKLLFLLVLLLTATTGAWAQAQTYKVTLQEGTEDATNWTIPAEAAEGATVTATYSGTRKVKSVKAVDPMLATPMTIEAITAGSINVANPKDGMQYSKNGGAKTAVTTSIDVAAGDKVQFYGNGTSITSYGSNVMSECTQITGSGDGFTCKVYGNIMSLVDEENFAKATTLSDSYTFKFLFYNNTKLTDASGLLLPATTLQESCYRSMFQGCTALAAAPALPATQLAAYCYESMFDGCSALTAAPVLPAKKLVNRCYYAMFNYCSKLATVTCLATSGINQYDSTSYWLNVAGTDVQGTKTVNTVSTANWPVDNYGGIPTGWTRVNIGAQSTEPTEWELTSKDGKNWILDKMPANDIELQVEYYAESNLFLGKEALADKANISVLNGSTAVEFDAEGKSTATVTEGNTVTVTYTGTKKVIGVKAEKKAKPLIVNPVVGQIIGSDGKNYDANATLPSGVTKVAMIAYVGNDAETSTTYNHGLALALEDVSDTNINWCSQTSATCLSTQYVDENESITRFNDLAGIANTDALVNHTGHTHDAASAARDYNSGTHPTGTSAWFLPSAGQWDKMATAAGSYANLITNAGLQGGNFSAYWSSTENDAEHAWFFFPEYGGWNINNKGGGNLVRACLAF